MKKYNFTLPAIIAKLEIGFVVPFIVFVNIYSSVGVDDWSPEFAIIASNDSSSVIDLIGFLGFSASFPHLDLLS